MIEKIKEVIRLLLFNERKFKPKALQNPNRLLEVQSAWKGNDAVLNEIIQLSGIETNTCLEFGVENAYSTVALSNYFKTVIGVDLFTGDQHSGFHDDTYNTIKERVKLYDNIQLEKSDYKDFIKDNNNRYDLIHVDIVHTYEDTFNCGMWAVQHASCTIFHDTNSFAEVRKAVRDIAKLNNKKFYNYGLNHGLGIVF